MAAYPWMEVARAELGVREVPGEEHSARILEYHAATTLHATADEVPWCAAFVSWCLEQAGVASPRSARSLDFLDYGVPCELIPGAIAVQDRGNGRGHVGFVEEVGEGAWEDTLLLLGGNQSNRVKVSRYLTSSFADFRLPVLEAPCQPPIP